MTEHKCPKCGTMMQALLFMGVQLEGYVCPECKIMCPVDDNDIPSNRPLAMVF